MVRPKGYHHSEETKRKIAEGNKGKVVSDETRAKLSASLQGRTFTEEWIEKIAVQNRGRKLTEEQLERKKQNCRRGETHADWKGDNIGYRSLHKWIVSNLPSQNACSCCGRNVKLEVHNTDGKYTRDFNSWIWVCRSCHIAIDNLREKWSTRMKEYNKSRRNQNG